ncbi:MAG: ORF6N domain-containing protein [Bacteroidales bacterium]|nr:ORF6N domain-containing protein [Bacteroidales bacterium]
MELQSIEKKIITIRDKQVILDSDIAELYGVETKRINEALKNNPDKFPDGYIIFLNKEEWENLKSKFSTSSWGGARKLPNALTEKGLYMLATILKSPKATQTTISIIETFAKVRELSRSIAQLSEQTDKNQQKSLMRRSGGRKFRPQSKMAGIIHSPFFMDFLFI